MSMTDTASVSRGVFVQHALRLFAICMAIAVVYGNTLTVPFIWDDGINISQNPLVRDMQYFTDLKLAEANDIYPARFFARRYIGYLTFALNYQINGLDVRGYHLVNILIHMASSVAVYFLALLLMNSPRVRGSTFLPWARDIAFGAALLFAVHPIQTQAVTYIVQRLASLAGMFYLFSLVFYALGRMARDQARSYGAFTASVLCAVLAMKTKEIAFTLPFAAALMEFTFFEGTIRKRVLWLVPLFCTLPIIPYAILSSSLWGNSIEGATSLETAVTRQQYFLTQITVVLKYLRMLFLPIGQNIDHHVQLQTSLLNGIVVMSALVLLVVVAFGVHLIVRAKRGADGALLLPGFGILFFFLALSIESGVFPIADLMFEHRVYLPSVGIAIAFSTGVCAAAVWFGKTNHPGRAMIGAFMLIAITLGIATFNRNETWRSDIGIWQDAVIKSPQKASAHNGLGSVYYIAGRSDEAIAELNRAVELKPTFGEAHGNLGILYISKKQWEKGILHILKAVEVGHETAPMMSMLGIAYKRVGLEEESLNAFNKAIELDPRSREVIGQIAGQ